jgi:ADP-ribose pyrophosphatase
MIKAGVERYRYDDGNEFLREKVWHPGAVGIVALDEDSIWLTRQPREVVGALASLEIPAGKLDIEGESPLDTAKRELSEEIGKRTEHWEEIAAFYTSPGFSDERVWLYLATELTDDPDAERDESERIEVVRWPLDRLDNAIAECEDSKTLIALLWLALREAPGRRPR